MQRFNQVVLLAIVSIVGVGLLSAPTFAQPGPSSVAAFGQSGPPDGAGPPESPGPPDHASPSDDEGIQGPPASNVLGAEDIWHNPTFTGGTGNNGETAHSEW